MEKKTRKQQAEDTKHLLFDTALELLNTRGYESITIRDIVQAAGVSIGTFYNYYQSKLDVFYETYQLADCFFTEEVAPRLVQDTVYEQILCFFDYYAYYSSEHTGLSLTKLIYNSNNKCFDRRSPEGMHPMLTALISEGMERGELQPDCSAEEFGQFLFIAVRGLTYHWCTNEGSYDLRQATRTFVERLLRGYRR